MVMEVQGGTHDGTTIRDEYNCGYEESIWW